MENKDQPLVSVIMNCYNGEKYLCEAIDSVYAQSYKNWEIIFWDNLSTDSSAKIAKSYDSKLRYFVGQETIPLGAARNKALEKCDGEYIAFLDVDDLWLTEKLSLQVPLFEKDNKVGLVYSDAIWFNAHNKKKKLSLKNKNKLKGYCFRELLTNYLITQSSVIIKKSALLSQSEWFDERFHLLEEADLFRRISYSWKLNFVDEPLAKWRIHEESSTWTMYEKIHEEGKLMLSKFSMLYHDFDTKYSKEIQDYKAGLQRKESIILWQKKYNSQARRCLSGYIFNNKKNLVLYFLTFLPYNFYKNLLSFFSIRLK
jgi:glycosyltransferase involved in cell wall biosynthesis